MYSLKVQLFLSLLVAVIGTYVSLTFFPHNRLSAILGIVFSLLISYGILYLFVYKPLKKFHNVLRLLKDKNSVARAVENSSEELQKFSEDLNSVIDSFQADIGQMKKLERVRNEFLGNVSHELRTPIFTTQGLIETLLNGAVDDVAVNRNFLQKALQNIVRLNSLLTDLIDISRIESGEMKLRFRFFDVVEFMKSIVAELTHAAEKRKIDLQCTFAFHEIEVYGDKDRLRQVMINLIENAIKYSDEEGKVRISIEDYSDRVVISVEDSGPGIPPQYVPRIFERFFRVDRDRSREVGGTGLGLAIVKHIIEAHNSSISVESHVGVGTKFTFPIWKTAKTE